jgi:hypothetical protein
MLSIVIERIMLSIVILIEIALCYTDYRYTEWTSAVCRFDGVQGVQ